MPNRNLEFGDFRITSVSGRVETNVDTGSSPLGLLAPLVGTWKGPGFNQIWRPQQPLNDGQYNTFLELNHTHEELQFVEIPGDIPNRALRQEPINLHAVSYLQKINDVHEKADIHFETGMWINVPAYENEEKKIVRLANIPHGTSIVAEGTAAYSDGASFDFDKQDITPFDRGHHPIPFPEMNLDDHTVDAHRTTLPTSDPLITQDMVNDPNSILTKAKDGINFSKVTKLSISTYDPRIPILLPDPTMKGPNGDTLDPNYGTYGGGPGVSNIAFLRSYTNVPFVGDPDPNHIGPNAQAVSVDATFYIEEFSKDGGTQYQLQYSQKVLLYFSGIFWPHVSVATLRRQ